MKRIVLILFLFCVSWEVHQMEIAPCPVEDPVYDEFGRRLNPSYSTNAIACWSTSVSHQRRCFQSLEEAEAFVARAPSSDVWGQTLHYFTIKEDE